MREREGKYEGESMREREGKYEGESMREREGKYEGGENSWAYDPQTKTTPPPRNGMTIIRNATLVSSIFNSGV
jgi:hypothetical protein